ncbi:MAG: PEP-CTERM sorting domain-containing protein [Akkermansiaceae bacterium]|nr:PEP-CTERM sorting domain-containing protein [Akkermansiaceae bacterium]
MKKTLFLLSSLALAAASAQAAVLCTTTFNRTGNSLDTVTVNTQSEYGLTSSTSISNFNKGGSPAGGQNGDLLGQSSIPVSVVTPNSNVASGGSWSMSFTFTNTASQDMQISSIDLTMIGVTGGGVAQNTGNGVAGQEGWVGGTATGNKPVNLNLSIEGGDSQTLAFNAATDGSASGNWNMTKTGGYDFLNGLILKAGESLTITINASQHEAYKNGCFAGLSGIQINGELVPEPATASLGLLGLAALMVRRRRA